MPLAGKKLFQFALVGLWLGSGAFGIWQLILFSSTPGASAPAMKAWPKESSLARAKDKATLLLFAHAECPCSSASLRELERLLPHTGKNLEQIAVFVQPGSGGDVTRSALWKKLAALPGVRNFADVGGAEARRFGAQTSGQIFLFDSRGKTLFQGGITPARGHTGDSVGRKAVIEVASSGQTGIHSAPVFGCALLGADRDIAGLKNE